MDKVNMKEEEEQACDDCGAGKMLLDANKGELYCDACGITTPSKDIMDANAGKTTYGGESATHQAVRNDENVNANIGTRMLPNPTARNPINPQAASTMCWAATLS